MIKVRLAGHDYRYEAFQIISLFYDKSEIEFASDDGEYDLESSLKLEDGIVDCTIYDNSIPSIIKRVELSSEDARDIKNSIKITLLEALKTHRGREIPWGILVGIRPTKIVHDLRSKGLDDEKIYDKLTSHYRLSGDKAKLTMEVADREERYLGTGPRDIGVYIGIPFCPTRCVYCSFTSNPIGGSRGLVEDYLEALLKEIRGSLRRVIEKGLNIDTLYIGGGTPTSLTAAQLKRLLDTVGEYVDLRNIREFTVEAGRPDSIDREKLVVIRDAGCRRISINPQTMNDETLKRIGRNHSSRDIVETYRLAREIGFDVINMDIIIGLPGEGVEEIKETIEGIELLSPENVTVHTMAIKRASILNEKEYRDKTELAGEMYDMALQGIRNMGLRPYYMYRQKNMVAPLENLGFCTENTEGIYNIQMIAENISVLAMGADAVTKLVFSRENRIERVANLKDVREYIARIDEAIENKIEAIDELEQYFSE